MAKKRSKKLDLILAELIKLRGEIRALTGPKPAKATKASKAKAAKPARTKAAKPQRKAAAPAKKHSPPKRPVLVAGSEAPAGAAQARTTG